MVHSDGDNQVRTVAEFDRLVFGPFVPQGGGGEHETAHHHTVFDELRPTAAGEPAVAAVRPSPLNPQRPVSRPPAAAGVAGSRRGSLRRRVHGLASLGSGYGSFEAGYASGKDGEVGPAAYRAALQQSAHRPAQGPGGSAPSLSQVLHQQLQDMQQTAGGQQGMVLFDQVMYHVARLIRVLALAGGHAVLLGQPSSGRRTAARLAAYVAGCALVESKSGAQMAYADWRDELKQSILRCGVDGQKTALLLDERDVSGAEMWFDISALVNNGEVPGLFSPDEETAMLERVRCRIYTHIYR